MNGAPAHLRVIVALGAALLAGCTSTAQRPQDAGGLPKQMRQHQVVVTLAQPSPQARDAAAQSLMARHPLSEAGRFPLDSIGVECAVFDVPPEQSLDGVMATFRADPDVESVQPNQFFETAGDASEDPYGKLEYAAKTIRADAAQRISTGKGVRVTVIDTGAETAHPDLLGRIVKTANFVDGGDASFATDRHGTAVAGIIGARAGNGVGIYGIAPDAELQVAKACWYAGAGDAKARCSSWTLAKAIDFALRENTSVINLSLKGPVDPLLERMLLAAEARGITVVAAASESGSELGFPAQMPSVIAVVASDADGTLKLTTALDRKPAVAAPGIDVITTVPGGNYDFVTGSSFSAAEVTGVVALLLERAPRARPDAIRDALRRSAKRAGPIATAPGVVDACAALQALGETGACR